MVQLFILLVGSLFGGLNGTNLVFEEDAHSFTKGLHVPVVIEQAYGSDYSSLSLPKAILPTEAFAGLSTEETNQANFAHLPDMAVQKKCGIHSGFT